MEIEKEIIKLSSCNKYILIQSFRTLINIINIENFSQKQINFREAEISFVDYFQEELIIGDKDGKLYKNQEQIQIHQGRFISGIIQDGILLSLGEDGYLKQTNLLTLQSLYERKLNNNIKYGQIFLLQSQVLVNYDLKVCLINLENDTIECKYKINQQGPLNIKINNLSKDYFSILGNEGTLQIYSIANKESLFTIQIQQLMNYELFYLPKKTTILFWNESTIYSYVYESELKYQFEIKVSNLLSLLQNNKLIIIYDNISNPKIKLISNLEGQKFKSLYQQEQLQKFTEQQQISFTNQEIKHNEPQTLAFYDFTYFGNGQQRNNEIKVQQTTTEQTMINVLKQSLIAQDKSILEYAIERTPQDSITESIKCLNLEQLQDLQNYIVDKIISYPEQTNKYIKWIKSIVLRGVGDFSKLAYFLEERTKNINKFESILSKIQFYKLTAQEKIVKDYRKQVHTVYEEFDSDVTILQGDSKQQQIQDHNQTEEIEENIDDDFNQAYKKHKQDLRQQAFQEIDEEIDDKEDLKF